MADQRRFAFWLLKTVIKDRLSKTIETVFLCPLARNGTNGKRKPFLIKSYEYLTNEPGGLSLRIYCLGRENPRLFIDGGQSEK